MGMTLSDKRHLPIPQNANPEGIPSEKGVNIMCTLSTISPTFLRLFLAGVPLTISTTHTRLSRRILRGVFCIAVIVSVYSVGVLHAQGIRQGGLIGRLNHQITAPRLQKSVIVDPLPAGIYTIGEGGAFASIDSVFGRLSAGGILGPVTFLLTDTLYVVSPLRVGPITLQGPIAGAGPASRITIRPADNVAATIKGDRDAVLWFDNVSYLTLDGISLQGSTRLRVQCLYNPATTWSDAIDFSGNCDHDVIQNLTASSDDNRKSYVVSLYGDIEGPDSCLVAGLFVPSGYVGIYVSGVGASARPADCIIRGNHIGSPADSLISRGIQVEGADGTIIEGNHVESIRAGYPAPNSTGQPNYALGINAYNGRNIIIRNNVVHNVCATMQHSSVQGILMSGSITEHGSNLLVYNNMVCDIRTRISQEVDLLGIGGWCQDSARVDFNSVYLSQSGSTFATYGSAALGLYNTMTAPVARNNILVNSRNDSSYGAWAIWGTDTVALSDYNDLHVGPYDSSSVAHYASVNYKHLNALKLAGRDVHSVSLMPSFRGPTDLHIDTLGSRPQWTPLANSGTTAAGCDLDHEGDNRVVGNSPDMGADEFWISPDPPPLRAPDPVVFNVRNQWNMVSVPLVLADCRKSVVAPTAISPAFAYDGGYTVKDTLARGVGYWLKFNGNQSYTLYGALDTLNTIDVRTGWNMIGSISAPVAVTKIASDPGGMITSKFFGYAGGYVHVDTIMPGRGYWVKVNQDGKLTLSTAGLVLPVNRIKIVPTDELPPSPLGGETADATMDIPNEFSLMQNYPNPFNPSTMIGYQVPTQSYVTLRIFDVLGREVATLVDAVEVPGYKSVNFDANSTADGLASGVYYYRLQAGSFIETKKLLLLR
jgi:hypothetical protein